MILVFAGAGASRALSAERYPTTAEFFQRLPPEVSGDSLFQQLVTFLSSVNGSDLIDIEQILAALTDLRRDAHAIGTPDNPVGWLLAENRINHIVGGTFDHRHTAGVTSGLTNNCDRLTAQINRQVYSLYSSPPTNKELADTWLPLLRELFQRDASIQLFTTNYDTILEHAIAAGPFPVETGRSNGPYTRLDLALWEQSAPSVSRSILTKLHGSVDWSRETDQIYVGTPTFKGDHTKQVIIYPGYKDTPTTTPFAEFHDHFAKALTSASIALFVGFAFRDPHINRLLAERLSTSAKIISVNPSGPQPGEPFGSRMIEHIELGFGPSTLKPILEAL